MKPERRMWLTVRDRLKPLDPVRVENPTWPGTPDVNLTLGWIELKYLNGWPVRESTAVRLPHFTKAQKNWHRKRRAKGGRSWVLLRVGERPSGENKLSEWLLFDGFVATEHLGRVPRAELYKRVVGRWKRTPLFKELLECLTRPL